MKVQTSLDVVVSVLSEWTGDHGLPLTVWQIYDLGRGLVDALGLDPMGSSRLDISELRAEVRVETGVHFVFTIPTKTTNITRIPPWGAMPQAILIELRTQVQRS